MPEDDVGTNFKTDTIEGYYQEEVFSKGLTRENTIEKQIQIALYFYSRGFWHEFEYSVKGLISILPNDLRDKIIIPNHNITSDGVEVFYKIFTSIQKMLEKDTNMIYKKKFIKTYE